MALAIAAKQLWRSDRRRSTERTAGVAVAERRVDRLGDADVVVQPGDNRRGVADGRLTERPVACARGADQVPGPVARARETVEAATNHFRTARRNVVRAGSTRASDRGRAVPRPVRNRGRHRPRLSARRTPLPARSAATGSRRDTPTRPADTTRAGGARLDRRSIGEHLARGHAQQQLRRRPEPMGQRHPPHRVETEHVPGPTPPPRGSRRDGRRGRRRFGEKADADLVGRAEVRRPTTERRRERVREQVEGSPRGAPCRRAGGREGQRGPSGDPSSVRCRSRGLRSPGRSSAAACGTSSRGPDEFRVEGPRELKTRNERRHALQLLLARCSPRARTLLRSRQRPPRAGRRARRPPTPAPREEQDELTGFSRSRSPWDRLPSPHARARRAYAERGPRCLRRRLASSELIRSEPQRKSSISACRRAGPSPLARRTSSWWIQFSPTFSTAIGPRNHNGGPLRSLATMTS